MTDTAIDLSRDGCPLNLLVFADLADTSPSGWHDLIVARYLHLLFHASWDPQEFTVNFNDNEGDRPCKHM